ncbi:hypothetical protein K1T71_013097 [Dendrolimus kikuchii]|uniref:Uncharacterized protein n=1 Tax=Dendrolimus kikuchii TaxID=765133 RepID=A0ACC1CJB4_9NEOP|nr:hypothetical protein K1T71_013097 [Dendrolimus kikuchii]
MKTLLVIVLVYAAYCVAQDGKLVLKKFPKKVSPGHKQYLDARRFVRNEPVQTKKANINKDYTVFPAVVPNEGNINVPDSPYFQYEPNVEQKTRVKKVLPVYISRKKRSADDIKDERDKGLESEKEYKKGKHLRLRSKAKKSKTHHKSKMDKHSKHEASHKAALKIGHEDEKQQKLVKIIKNKAGKIKNKVKSKKIHKKSDVEPKKSIKDARRLIAGKDALIEEYPYAVSIQKNKQHWCSGALLNPRLVITTANCLWKAISISRMRVRVGSRFTDRGGQMAKIQEVMKHPSWGLRRNPDNDVALMLLDRNVRFSDSVHSVDLPNRVMTPAFDDAWVTSWGAERRDGIYDSRTLTLQVYHTRLMSREKCNNVTHRFGVLVSENFICLAQTGKRAPCTRDTGAPAVSDGVLWGLASWGIRKLCGTERFPAMFSYLASHSNMDFITNATHNLMADERHYPFPDRYPLFKVNT